MARQIAKADGPFLTLGTFDAIVDGSPSNGYQQASAGTVDVGTAWDSTTAFQGRGNSAFDGPNGVSTDGVMLFLEQKVGATGTFTVETFEIGGAVQGSVTVNVADLPASGSPKWVFFKYAAPYVTANGFYHSIRFKSSVNATVRVWGSPTSNDIAFFTRKTSVGAIPVSGDTAYIVGELTGPGTGVDRYVTPGVETGITVLVGQRGFHSAPPVTAETWTNGAADNAWETTGNWDLDTLPDSTISVALGGTTNADITISATRTTKAFDARGYTGHITHPAYAYGAAFNVYGDVHLDSGVAAEHLYFEYHASATFSPGGFTGAADIAAYTASGVTVAVDANAFVSTLDMENDNVLSLGAHTLEFVNGSGNPYIALWGTAAITWSAGAKLIVSADEGTAQITSEGGTFPPVEISAAAVGLELQSDVTVDSYAQAGGTLTGAHELTVTNDFASTGGALSGVEVSVGGSAVASDTTIANCDFSGGAELDATDGCTDGGGNINVDFGISPATQTRGAFSASAA